MAATTRKKGPIRWEAVLPFAIFVALVWAYFFFFFDAHLRRALEYVGTQINGAEVNIAKVRTSFWNATLQIQRIQITDTEEPRKNRIEIGEVRWKMLWDALLRGKIAIDEASILGIAIGTPRARPGYVIPPPPPNEDPGAFEKIKAQALAKVQEEFSQNVLGDLAALLGGVDPAEQLKNIETELKSSLRLKELQEELAKKEQEWKERLSRLPQQKDLQAIEMRLKSVKLDRFNSPAELQQSLQEIDSIFKEIDAKIKDVDATKNALGTDLTHYQNAFRELETMVRQDLKDLENRLKLPKLDMQSLSRSIFGPMFLSRVKEAESYLSKAREYMPPKKSEEEKAAFKPPTPRERAEGRNYKFGRPRAYPLFWLREAKISSKASPDAEWSGNLEGTLHDLTDDPPTLGRPTVLTFKGDFPKQEVMGVDGRITIDHVTDKPVEKAEIKIASYPLVDRVLVDSPDIKLLLANAVGNLTFQAELSGDAVKISTANVFERNPNPPPAGENTGPVTSGLLAAEAKEPLLADLLKGALNDVRRVTLNASLSGTWSNLGVDIDSSLGRDLAAAFDKQIKAKVNEARVKFESFINERIGQEKAKLTAEFNKVKAQIDSLIKTKEAEINKLKNDIEKAKNEALEKQKKDLEQQGQKAIDDLKKKLGF